MSFRIVQGTGHLTASTLTAVDIPRCPRKVKKRHTNTAEIPHTVILSFFTLVCTAVPGCSLEVLDIDYALNRHFCTVQMGFVLRGLAVILSTAGWGEVPALPSLSTPSVS